MNIFAEATKKKLRFFVPSPATESIPTGGAVRTFHIKGKGVSGNLSIEELWDLEMVDLRKLKTAIKRQVADLEIDEESLDASEVKALAELKLKLQILEEVSRLRTEESDAAKAQATERVRKQRIAALIEQKEDGKLADLSLEELKAML